jgi:hypothetical protein
MVVFLTAGTGSAWADDFFVDAETGVDVGPSCVEASPCATLAYAVSNSAAGDTIRVDNGTYTEAVTLADGRSLVHQDFVAGDGGDPPLIDGAASTGITTSGSGGGLISGVRVHSETIGILLNAATVVDESVFDEPDAPNAVGVQVNGLGAGSEVSDGQFSDPAPSASRARAGVYALGTAWIHDNSFDGLMVGINVNPPSGGDTLVERNELTGTHSFPFAGRAILAGSFSVADEVIVRENRISDGDDSFGTVDGIHPYGNGSVRLIRNEVTEHFNAVFVGGDYTGIDIRGDRYWGNDMSGLSLSDNAASPPETSVTATNVTIVNSGGDIRVNNSHLTLNSSIVGVVALHAGPDCTVTHSIGPANPGSDTSGCFDFASNADPGLADPSTGDLHLTVGSPAIDMGDPADPGSGEVDFDGDPRAVDGADACPPEARRDIGADEFVPASPIDCTPPETTITSGPADGGATSDPTPTFGFESNEAGSTFECAVDGGPFGPCSGAGEHTMDLSSQPDGEYEFEVRATDAGSNVDPSPASRTFRLDRAAPQTTISSGPANGLVTNDPTQTYGFSASEAGDFECKVDAGAFGPCTGAAQHTVDLISAPDGQHTFSVRAIDDAGNVDSSPATRTLVLDQSAPETTLTKKPPKKLKKKKAKFSFIADEDSTYTCQLDSKPEFDCAGTVKLKVKPGKHKFSVFATDTVGNADATPATHKFKRVKKKRKR